MSTPQAQLKPDAAALLVADRIVYDAMIAYAAKHFLCEHGVPRRAKEPVCGCPGNEAQS